MRGYADHNKPLFMRELLVSVYCSITCSSIYICELTLELEAFRDAFLHLRSFGPTAGAPSPLLSCTRDPDLSIHRPLQLLPNSLDNSIDLTLCNNDFIFDMIIHDSAELLQTHLK